jgi:hypothetical protein
MIQTLQSTLDLPLGNPFPPYYIRPKVKEISRRELEGNAGIADARSRPADEPQVRRKMSQPGDQLEVIKM